MKKFIEWWKLNFCFCFSGILGHLCRCCSHSPGSCKLFNIIVNMFVNYYVCKMGEDKWSLIQSAQVKAFFLSTPDWSGIRRIWGLLSGHLFFLRRYSPQVTRVKKNIFHRFVFMFTTSVLNKCFLAGTQDVRYKSQCCLRYTINCCYFLVSNDKRS